MDIVSEPLVSLSHLPGNVRVLAAVGYFFQEFARLEDTAEEVIETLTGIPNQQGFLLLEHIPFAKKASLLKAVAENSTLTQSEKDRIKQNAKAMLRLNGDMRVSFAHRMFRFHNDGVATTEPGANGPVLQHWTWEQFDNELECCRHARKELVALMIGEHWKRFTASFDEMIKKSASREMLIRSLGGDPDIDRGWPLL